MGPDFTDSGSELYPATDAVPHAEMKRRTLAGVFYLASTGVTNLVIGFGSNLLLARMLTPRDFGLVAVGSTITLLGGALADGGLGSGMIRRHQAPTRAELRTLSGIQLVIGFVIVAVTATVGLQFGEAGQIATLMSLTLPIMSLQTPGRVLLAREMRYDRQAIADFGGQASSQLLAVAAVALGAGVWGLAAAIVCRAAVSTGLMNIVSDNIHLPSLAGWRELRDLMRFGIAFQSNWISVVVREQLLNLIVGAVAGVQMLGVWSLARRIFEVPLLFFGVLWNVSFPSMANLVARGEDPGPVIVRVVRRAGIAGALAFVPFAVVSPTLIPVLFGSQWRQAGVVMPLLLLSLLLQGAISVGTIGYFFAIGKPGLVVRASIATGIAALLSTAGLLPLIGIRAVGVGAVVGAIVEAVILGRAAERDAAVAPLQTLLTPLAIAVAAGGIGLVLAALLPERLVFGVGAALLSTLISFGGLAVACRSDLVETLRMIERMARDALGRPRDAQEQAAG